MPDPGDGDPAVGLVEVDDVVLVLGAGPEAAVHTHDTLRSKQGNKSRTVCRFWLSTSFFFYKNRPIMPRWLGFNFFVF